MAPILGSRSTALQAVTGFDLTGKTAVITGEPPCLLLLAHNSSNLLEDLFIRS